MTLRKAVMWSYVGQFGSVFILFALSIIIARLLTPFEVGIYAVGAAVSAILTAISTVGLISYVVRAENEEPKIATAFTLNCLGSLLLSMALLVTAVVGPFLGMASELVAVLYILALRPVFSIVEFLPTALLQRNLEFKILGLATLAASCINLITTTSFALSGYGAMSMAFGVITAIISQICIYAFVIPNYFSLRFSLFGWKEVARFGVEIITISGASVITKRVCELIIGVFIGISALGLFTRATNIADTLFNGIYGAGTKVVFANLCREKRDTGLIAPQFLLSFELLISIFWPAVIGIAILSGPVILTLYGEIWLPAAPVLAVLMMGQVMALTFALNWELFVIAERTSTQVRYEIIRSFVSLAAFATGSYYGLVGAASGRFVDAAVGMLLYIPAYQLLVPVSKKMLLRIYLRCSIGTVAATLPVLCTMYYFEWNAHTSLVYLGASALGGMILYIFTHYFMQSPLWLLLTDFSKSSFRKNLSYD